MKSIECGLSFSAFIPFWILPSNSREFVISSVVVVSESRLDISDMSSLLFPNMHWVFFQML